MLAPLHTVQPLLAVAASHLPLRPGEKGWVEIASGAMIVAIFGLQIWWAHQPGGSFTLGRYSRGLEVTRALAVPFWFLTVLFAAFCAVGAFMIVHGVVTVFLWMTR